MAIIATGSITITDLQDGSSGGRNYIRNSSDMINDNYHGIANSTDFPNAQYARLGTEVPDGSEDSVLQLSKFSGATYSLGTLPHVEDKYIYTVWAKALTDMSLNINMLGLSKTQQLDSDDGWVKIEIANPNPTTKYITITPTYSGSGSAGDLLLYRSMLELGDVASDWSPAPEDSDEETMLLAERVSRTETITEPNALITTVTESTKYKSDLAGVKDTMTQEISTSISQYNDSVQIQFDNITNTYAGAKEYTDKASSWQTFDQNGIHMGKSNSPFTMDLSNEQLAFNENGTPVASISNQALQITEAVIQTRFRIGKFAFVPTDTGMALIYVGDQN